jgi:predicted Zn-dependent peptidase
MVTSSLLTSDDVEAEREVILDEIAMHDDDPEDVVTTLHARLAYGDSPLGRPIAGTAASIGALTRDQVVRFYRRHVRPENVVVAAAGNLDHDDVVRRVGAAFSGNGWLDGAEEPTPPRRGRFRTTTAGAASVSRPFEQANVVLGFDGLARTDDRRYALGVLNTALGGGPSSRLFQEVRERRGLAYSVYSYASHAADAGTFCVGAGCLPGKLDDVLRVVRSELATLRADGITEDELRRGKGQLRGGLVLGLEDSGARMSRIAKAELLYDELPSVEEMIARLDAVTLEGVHDLARTLLGGRETRAVVGPA